ncbi:MULTISPECIES: acyl-CoA thioesterase [Polaromonas]|uniref:Acyl-CoA thioesterase n=1 Tax=Polaromonas aquatica TaxID=332657 RepID=A0ABW1U222_9BURK
MTKHLFDQALELQAAGSDRPDTWLGTTSPAYWNMVGPFGGSTAATALQAVMQHPALLGEPIALTVNYASATAEGPFSITATPVRTNRSTQHWVLSLNQPNAKGEDVAVMTATAMTALRRETWQVNDMPMPDVPAPKDVERARLAGAMEWLNRYDMRFVRGGIPRKWDGADKLSPDSLTQLWVRDDVPRPLDFASITAMADVFYPRVWLRRPLHVPAGTVSMTVYFHASAAQLQQAGTGYVLAQARGQAFRHGFFDQSAQLWDESGTLLVTSHQLVYFKE